jgi:hypothetical protein
MKRIGNVDSEGGPLLLVEARLAAEWSGGEGEDYGRACDVIEKQRAGGPIAVGSGSGLVWAMGGAGTADVFSAGNDLLIVRIWTDEDDADAATASLAAEPLAKTASLGAVEISTALCILWAPEANPDVGDLSSRAVRRPRGLGIDNAGLIVPVEAGTYDAATDKVKNARGEAVRLHLKRR